jgi:hypothetical protein
MRKAFTGVTLVAMVVNLGLPERAAAQGRQAPERPLLTAAFAAAARASLQPSGGPQAPDAWKELEALPIGTRVRITVNDGSEFEGELVAATADAVTLQHNTLRKGQFRARQGVSLDDALPFQRTAVSSVRIIQNGREVPLGQVEREPRSWPGQHPILAGFLIGAAAGALVGTGTGCVWEYGDECPGLNAAFLAPVLGGVGALVGLGFRR